jgi:uncharacterized protein
MGTATPFALADKPSNAPLLLFAPVVLVLALAGCQGRAGGVNVWKAVQADDPEQIEQYVQAGGDVNIQRANGSYPLYEALMDNKPKAYAKLLELGADPNIIFGRGRVVIHYAATKRGTSWLKLALEHGGDPNLVNEGAKPPFHPTRPLGFAMQGRHYHLDKVKLLVEHGADINAKELYGGNKGCTYLDVTMRGGRFDAALYFLEQGADYENCTCRNQRHCFLEEVRTRKLSMYRMVEDQQQLLEVRRWLDEQGVEIEYPDDGEIVIR